MFILFFGGSYLNLYCDFFGGLLCYYFGLFMLNLDNCCIYVDGQFYVWWDGEDVMFDEIFVYWVKNEIEQIWVIFFCDIEWLFCFCLLIWFNCWISGIFG